MKFLIGAQLPRRLIAQLTQAGLEAIHTVDLPQGNRTPDSVINERSIREQYVVVTKDSDFVESFLLGGQPWKLLLISTGNIRNADLRYTPDEGKTWEQFDRDLTEELSE